MTFDESVQNILFVTHHDGLSGANQSLLSLLDGLMTYPICPFFVVPKEGDFTNALIARNVPYKIVPVVYWLTEKPVPVRKKMAMIGDIHRSVQWLRTLIKEWAIDIVYTNTTVSPIGRFAAFLERLPHIWHLRELVELHFAWKFILPRFLALALIKNSAAVISVCEAVNNYYFAPGAKQAHVVYNGIATAKEYDALYLRKNGFSEPARELYVFAIIGSITQQKGQEIAIRAVAELYGKGLPVRLLVVGTGKPSVVSQLKKLVEVLGIVHLVEFTGQIQDSYEIYFRSDCLLMCSGHEGLSRVTIEAMSASLPVIGINSGGTPEIIRHEKTGLLYNNNDELVSAMMRMAENPDWGRQLGVEGWKVAKERFNTENYAAGVYEIIQSLSKT